MILLCSVASFATISPAQAQDPNYAPPPMFDDMTPPMVRPQGQDGYLVSPKASVNTPLPDPTLDRPPVVVPRVSVDPDSQRAVPVPPKPATVPSVPIKSAPPVVPAKPSAPVVQTPAPTPPSVTSPVPAKAPAPSKPEKMKPIVEETYIKRDKPAAKIEAAKPSNEEPRTENIGKEKSTSVPPSAVSPVIQPAKRDPQESAIQGPKTMPALPTENVDQQVTFDTAPETPETIMERHRKEVQGNKEETLTPIVPAPNPNVSPASFEPAEQGVLKKIIPFQPGQIGLPQAEADPIVAGIVKQLDGEDKKDWRVQIRSYATPHGTGLSSDRRIALSRALSLRTTMIAQGVAASAIDLTAEGLQSEGGNPPDRVDVYLYGPKEE